MARNDMKSANDIEIKKKNRKWKLINCHCKLFLDYVSFVGYLSKFTHSNAPFVEQQGGWFLLMGCVKGVCEIQNKMIIMIIVIINGYWSNQ